MPKIGRGSTQGKNSGQLEKWQGWWTRGEDQGGSRPADGAMARGSSEKGTSGLREEGGWLSLWGVEFEEPREWLCCGPGVRGHMDHLA